MSQKEKSKQTQTSGYTGEQTEIASQLAKTYSPYIGTGTLGGLSDLEQSALNMLKSADIWGPLTSTGTGLLTGTVGAKPITPESASLAFKGAVEEPAWYNWQDKIKPEIQESFAGPGYWGSARANAVAEGAGDVGRWLGSQKANWMWNAEQANRAIEEAKAGRALSALGAVPSSLGGWANTLFGTGSVAREIQNAITDPQVLQVLGSLLNRPMGTSVSRSVAAPSEFQQAANWTGVGLSALGGLGGLGGASPWVNAAGQPVQMSDQMASTLANWYR